MKKQNSSIAKYKSLIMGLILPAVVLSALFVARTSTAADKSGDAPISGFALAADAALPTEIDARGGTPRGISIDKPLTAVQSRALGSLQNLFNGNLQIRFNGLTSTPMNITSRNGYLTAASTAAPEFIARDFIRQWREIFRFDENDLNNLKLMSRAVSAEGITVMLFQQQANGLGVYHGEVLVNVNRAGRIINVGGDSFPRLNITNSATLNPAAAVSAAALSMGVNDFVPQSLGEAKILTTYGELTPEYAIGEKFAHNVFMDDIDVQKIVFPLGDEGRIAYKFNLTYSKYKGIIWQNIVDAQTGAVLRRLSLTAAFGEPGGGTGANRRGTFRPDVQDMVEANNPNGTARGLLFDTEPATLSPVGGATAGATAMGSRLIRTGTAPNYTYTRPGYELEATLTNHFRYSMVLARNEAPLFFTNSITPQTFTQAQFPGVLGQVTRGLPDAANPNAASPFGWFYLPTDSNGQEVTTANSNRALTRVYGYSIAPEAQTRNLAVNSPTADKSQPYSVDATPLGGTVTLADGRVLNSVLQSRYTEGNNVGSSDDRQNDNEATNGIKGYAANRQFSADYYKYYANYELSGVDATGGGTAGVNTSSVVYPASADSDVYPAAVNLFYFNNVEHDYLYSIGFTEPFWNFQMDNFGKGGAAGDAIVAQVQDGSGTDNANMGTPAEGASPRMQMYLFTDGGFRRSDGDLDWDVVAHEHYHGVSNRSAAKGGDSCLGTPLVGESGGMGEGWSDFIATSMSDDDSEGENVTGEFDKAIRRLPYTNYRYSYGSINDATLNVRKSSNTAVAAPDLNAGGIPFEVHDIGEVWAATLWDMRELMIVAQNVGGSYPGVFFDGNRRLGSGAGFYVGNRLLNSIDANHPIDYRAAFGTSTTSAVGNLIGQSATINAPQHIVRPGLVAAEIAAVGNRRGGLATAVSRGAFLADKITLRGLQITPCNPTFIDMRDAMLAADREITGGEYQAIIWRSFASHGVGTVAQSTGRTNGTGQQGGPAAIVEDFSIPADVAACETSGPLTAPTFSLANTAANTVNVTITPVTGATIYVIARSTNPNGPFTTIATQAGTTYADNDNGQNLVVGQTYYYQVHAGRNASCISTAATNSITVTIGAALSPAPLFAGVAQVVDPQNGARLILNWAPAISTNPNASIVYDIYRVKNVTADTDKTAPSLLAADITSANRIAVGITGTSYTDTGLITGQQYYYVVRARDTNNGKIDNNDIGNFVTKFNAPTSPTRNTNPFPLENFETAASDNRFNPMLIDSATPNQSLPMWQRVPGINFGTGVGTSTAMFAPDFDPAANMGAPSDFFTTITPAVPISRGSFLEFDHQFATEATFDGGNLEISLGSPLIPATPNPDNVVTFDLNDYIVQGGYTGALNGTLEGAVIGSVLQGRQSFTGTKSYSHVRVAIGDFAPGAIRNPTSLPVYIRFRMTSDAGTAVQGWFIDNVVINNYAPPTAAPVELGGVITDAKGRGLSNIAIQLNGSDNQLITATTDFKGRYSFPSLAVGSVYVVTPVSKQYSFNPQSESVSLSGERGNVNFTASGGGRVRVNAETQPITKSYKGKR